MPIFLHVLHVAGAVFIVGPMAILPMIGLRAIRAGEHSQVRLIARSTFAFSLASIAVALVGFGVMATGDPDDHWSITTGWILTSIVLYAVACISSLVVVVPALRRSAAANGAAASGYSRVAASSGVTTLLLLAVVVLMIWQP